jgi:hypothetical protein
MGLRGDWVEASELPESEKVYLKKDIFGWRVIQPWKNEDGTINWFNLLTGGKKNIAILIFLLVLAGLFYLGVQEVITNYSTIANNPCEFCKSCTELKPIVINSVAGEPFMKVNVVI